MSSNKDSTVKDNSSNTNNNNPGTVIQTPSNLRSNQRTSNPNRQRNTRRNRRDDPDYDPEDDDNFHERNPLYYVSTEYAQYCLDNGDYSRLSRKEALDILDQQ
ncbi:13610_t:CDS:2 [Acaulospora colombiana]|uniref:13610_t:CDS:1 n=1 Tax=Acaulospora colombiana TaxID=27376 RepID=A0ACA9M824_9GLOM|nr:13610_t:CDS:2 [Acaulospora colombiana]